MKTKELLENHTEDLLFHYYGGKDVELLLSTRGGEIELGFISIKYLQKCWRETLNYQTPVFRKKHIHRKGYWYEFY